jgi:hypothetical protein
MDATDWARPDEWEARDEATEEASLAAELAMEAALEVSCANRGAARARMMGRVNFILAVVELEKLNSCNSVCVVRAIGG